MRGNPSIAICGEIAMENEGDPRRIFAEGY
jgi:hypothetical protein